MSLHTNAAGYSHTRIIITGDKITATDDDFECVIERQINVASDARYH